MILRRTGIAALVVSISAGMISNSSRETWRSGNAWKKKKHPCRTPPGVRSSAK